MIKFRATIYGPQITGIEILSETEKFITFLDVDFRHRQRREAKKTDSYGWFDTWAEARDWLAGVAEKSLESAKQRRLTAERLMDSVLGMTPPV